MRRQGFEGWYFKHQKGDQVLSFIPGRTREGAFLQMLWPGGSRQFHFPALERAGDVIRLGNCRFSPGGCVIDLPGVRGEIAYGPLTPLASDIMGPFRFFPMECRHQIFSMAHSLRGEVAIDGEVLCFDGGTGYWEGDRGVSFPSSYLWAQCNTFPENCAFMASVAEIPFCGLRFRGCICAVLWNGKEYRFATYRGVRIPTAERDRVVLSQGRLRLDLQIRQTLGHTLASPILGKMSGRIRECCNVPIRLRLWEGDRQLFDLSSPEGMFEFQK